MSGGLRPVNQSFILDIENNHFSWSTIMVVVVFRCTWFQRSRRPSDYKCSDIQQRIRTDNHAVLKTVKIWTGRSWVLPKHLLKMRRSNYPDNCLIIDINSMNSMTKMLREGTLQIFFRFHRVAGFNVELKLEDRERVVDRADKSGRLAYSGPLMRWEQKSQSCC